MTLFDLTMFAWLPPLFLFFLRKVKKLFSGSYNELLVLGEYARHLKKEEKAALKKKAVPLLAKWLISLVLLFFALSTVFGLNIWIPFNGITPARYYLIAFFLSFFVLKFAVKKAKNLPISL